MPTQQLTQATLETIGRPKQSRYEGKPDYRPCLFKLASGEQRWKSYSVGAPELDWLTRGATYQAVIAGDDFNIIQPDGATVTTPPAPTSAPAPPQQQATGQLSKEQKQAIAAYVGDMGDLYAYCLSQAQEKIGASSDSETVRCMASSLFIAASKRFDL